MLDRPRPGADMVDTAHGTASATAAGIPSYVPVVRKKSPNKKMSETEIMNALR